MTRKHFAWTIINLVFILIFSSINQPLSAKPSFSVAPGIFFIDLNRFRTESLVLTNTGDERIRLLIKPVYFAVDSSSLQAGIPLNKDAPIIDDISDSILVSPRIVVLGPGAKRNARFSVRPKSKLPEGDYRAHLLVRILEGKPDQQEGSEHNSSETMSIQLTIKMETGVAVYGRIGKADTTLSWDCQLNDENTMDLFVTNPSKWNFRGWVGLFDGQGEQGQIVWLSRLISFRESYRVLSSKMSFAQPMEIRWGFEKDQLTEGKSVCQPQSTIKEPNLEND